MRKQPIRLRLLCFALIPPAFCFGCSENANTPTPTDARAERASGIAKQIKEIDDNPNMPPNAKAAAKASLLSHQNMDLSKH